MGREGLSHDPAPFGRVLARFGDQLGFEAQVVEANGAAVVVAVGEIDMATAGPFRQAIDLATRDGRVVIDLAGTTFMDSSGLAVLVGVYQQLGRRRDAVVLRSVGDHVRHVVEIAGIDRVVTIVDRSVTDDLPLDRDVGLDWQNAV